MANHPLYSNGPHEDLGDPTWFWLLLGVAAFGGFLFPRHAPVIGLMLVLPALLWSPWSTPRGDDDGLWLLVVPFLAMLMGFTLLTAMGFGFLRRHVTGAR